MKSKIIIIVLTAFLAGCDDYQVHADNHKEYCSMVKLFKESNGNLGWPDYKGSYTQNCEGV